MSKKAKEVIQADQLALLIKTINCDNDDTARMLISQAVKAAYAGDSDIDDNGLNGVIALIRGIGPEDATEVILVVQFIVLHLQGMSTMTKTYTNAKGQGMMLLRLSHHALDMLQRYRSRNQAYNALHHDGAVLVANGQ